VVPFFDKEDVRMKKILIGFVIIIVVAVAGYYTFPETTAQYLIAYERSKAGLAKKEVTIGDHNIVYLEGGKGPTILLLHGYTANKDNWTRFAAKLTKNYHVVIPDLPCYGESTKLMSAKYDLSSQIDRLHRFTQALHMTQFHIAGNSMGGWFSGAYAALYPDEVLSLGLFDAAGVQSLQKSEVAKLFEKGENPLLLKGENDFARLMGLIFVKPPYFPYPIKVIFLKNALDNKRFNEKAADDFKDDRFSLEKELPNIKAPTLILWGEKDQILDVSSVPVFEKGLKNHKTVIIKECGHIPMIERVQETATEYLAFINSIKT
jgi:abhydrolase domain-containing protein 6